jgi:hypothetical protein
MAHLINPILTRSQSNVIATLLTYLSLTNSYPLYAKQIAENLFARGAQVFKDEPYPKVSLKLGNKTSFNLYILGNSNDARTHLLPEKINCNDIVASVKLIDVATSRLPLGGYLAPYIYSMSIDELLGTVERSMVSQGITEEHAEGLTSRVRRYCSDMLEYYIVWEQTSLGSNRGAVKYFGACAGNRFPASPDTVTFNGVAGSVTLSQFGVASQPANIPGTLSSYEIREIIRKIRENQAGISLVKIINDDTLLSQTKEQLEASALEILSQELEKLAPEIYSNILKELAARAESAKTSSTALAEPETSSNSSGGNIPKVRLGLSEYLPIVNRVVGASILIYQALEHAPFSVNATHPKIKESIKNFIEGILSGLISEGPDSPLVSFEALIHDKENGDELLYVVSNIEDERTYTIPKSMIPEESKVVSVKSLVSERNILNESVPAGYTIVSLGELIRSSLFILPTSDFEKDSLLTDLFGSKVEYIMSLNVAFAPCAAKKYLESEIGSFMETGIFFDEDDGECF